MFYYYMLGLKKNCLILIYIFLIFQYIVKIFIIYQKTCFYYPYKGISLTKVLIQNDTKNDKTKTLFL